MGEKTQNSTSPVMKVRYYGVRGSIPTPLLPNYIEKKIIKTEQQGITVIKALSLAYSFEETMLEHQFFNVIESDNPRIKEIFKKLEQDTEKHLQRIKTARDSIKKDS